MAEDFLKNRRHPIKFCLDPGHGGHDPGAVGPTNLHESKVALDISQRVGIALSGIGVVIRLTRDTDVFVELSHRCSIANVWHADYFCSIHLNSNGESSAGIETLYKSENGKNLAFPIQAELIEATGDKDRGLKKRDDLYVLNGTLMPAVLVECGFISNPFFEAKFRTEEYREIVASAIATGIAKFLGLAPPLTPPVIE